MADILINSILGGESLTSHFATKDQFGDSLGIDPAYPLDSTTLATNSRVMKASGLLRPVGSAKFSGTTITNAPMWQVPNPKNSLVYVYDARSSAYSIDPTGPTVTALSDAGTLSSTGHGDGCEYYDNYIYFSTPSDLTRYGPLDGTPGFQISYWQATLGLSAIPEISTPGVVFNTNLGYPRKVLKRHSDGKMYIGHKTAGGQGAISYVSTTKTTVEGDTNNGSTFSKLVFGYGLFPVAIESYGGGLAIALMENSAISTTGGKNRAKLAFWDTVSTNFNSMLWVEFPDELITAIKNVNGVLYIASGNYNQYGCRISRYVGGYSIKEVAYYESAIPPFQGAMDGTANNLIFGSTTDIPEQAGAVYSVGLHKGGITNGNFKIMRASGNGSSVFVSSLALSHQTGFTMVDPWIGWSDGNTGSGTTNGMDSVSENFSANASVWRSQLYNIGQPFQIKRIRIPLAQTIAAGVTIVPKLYFDNATTSQALTTINSTNFPTTGPGAGLIANIKTAGDGSNIVFGQQNFSLELKWSGTVLSTVDLPILIEYDIIPD